jgi:hypothetical protein
LTYCCIVASKSPASILRHWPPFRVPDGSSALYLRVNGRAMPMRSPFGRPAAGGSPGLRRDAGLVEG